MSNLLRYLVTSGSTWSMSSAVISLTPFSFPWSGSAYRLTWCCGLLLGGRGLNPISYSFIQSSARW